MEEALLDLGPEPVSATAGAGRSPGPIPLARPRRPPFCQPRGQGGQPAHAFDQPLILLFVGRHAARSLSACGRRVHENCGIYIPRLLGSQLARQSFRHTMSRIPPQMEMQEPLLDSGGEGDGDEEADGQEPETPVNPHQMSRNGLGFPRGGYHSDVGAAGVEDTGDAAAAAATDYDEEAPRYQFAADGVMRAMAPTLGRARHKRVYKKIADKRGVRLPPGGPWLRGADASLVTAEATEPCHAQGLAEGRMGLTGGWQPHVVPRWPGNSLCSARAGDARPRVRLLHLRRATHRLAHPDPGPRNAGAVGGAWRSRAARVGRGAAYPGLCSLRFASQNGDAERWSHEMYADTVRSFTPTKDVFFTPYGCVVCWGVPEEDEGKILDMIKPHQDDDTSELASDDMAFTHGEASRVKKDVVTLSSTDPVEKLAVSFALAQSVKLSIFENRIAQTIAETRHIPVHLSESGSIGLSQLDISKQIGALFIEVRARLPA